MNVRRIARTVNGTAAVDGAGVRLVRVLSRPDVGHADPFLMLDAFDSTDPEDYVKGFPWHPHRGIETITYLIDGHIEHGDSIGNRGTIGPGECQWMTAGSGILHQEMPRPAKRMLGAQLWLNLPAKDKMCPPKYRDVRAGTVPVATNGGASVRILAGVHEGIQGAVSPDYVDIVYLDVGLAPGATFRRPVSKTATAFAYLFEGSFAAGDAGAKARDAAFFEDGDEISVVAGKDGARFLFAAGEPLDEPIAWGGPIVMNTREELRTAFRELDEGTFLKR
ncbi:MAG: pirin family protein [Candidatus Izemoplasmatales bacterium]